MSTAGTIRYGFNEYIHTNYDGHPDTFGYMALLDRLRLEKKMEENDLTKKEAMSLLFANRRQEHGLQSSKSNHYNDNWYYEMTEDGLLVKEYNKEREVELSFEELENTKDPDKFYRKVKEEMGLQ